MTKKQDTYVQWLRDAHAMEEQALTMLESLARRLEHYPELKARLQQHITETKSQREKLGRCLERHGGSSTIKDTAGKLTAMMQGLSGLFVGDEVVKGAMASYAFEHFEISSYRTLIGAAGAVGDLETKRVCEEILKEEEAMATWLSDHLPQLAERFLEREEAGVEAKH